VLVAMTVGNFVVAGRLEGKRGRVWFWAGVVANVGTIFALRQGGLVGTVGVIGPSFYGLQAISYLSDTYTGALRVRPTLAELALYLAYFPKLLAGPLERPDTFVASLRTARPGRPDALAEGIALIALGAARKLLLADPLRFLVPDGTFTDPGSLPASELVYGLLAYVFFLYNDFAGYTDIARGTSALFGIPLSINFAQPFLSSNFSEFWGRWHASLSRWLRGYVYLPVSRALLRRRWDPRSLANVLVPATVTMLVSGVWHGTRSGMILWGMLQGSFLIAERLARPRRRQRAAAEPLRRRILGSLKVFVLISVALTAARAGVGGFPAFWVAVGTNGGWALPSAALCAAIATSLLIDLVQRQSENQLVFLDWPRPVRAGLLALTIAACALATGAAAPPQFVYAAF
jgi:D-alanyl-lipoteichoic acid acyltransferase DltB (MBOAT superfamily)